MIGRSRSRVRSRMHAEHPTQPLFAIDFTQQTVGPLTFARASGAKDSAQQSESTVTIGYATNAPRFGRPLAADALALLMEPSRVNSVPDARNMLAGSWTTQTAPTGGQTGIDGTANAMRETVASGGFGNDWTSSLAAGTYTFSSWQKSASGGALYGGIGATNGAANISAFGGTAPAAFTRYAVTPTAQAAGICYHIPVDATNRVANGGIAAGNRDVIVDGNQVELGKWASEFINSSGGAATRAGEQLTHPHGPQLVSAGRIALDFYFKAKCSPANADAAMRFWTSGSDYAEVSTSGVLTISIGGVTNTCNLTWNALDVMRVHIAAGQTATSVYYSTNGGAPSIATITGSPLAAISPASTIDLLCNGTSNQLAGWHYSIQAYR